MNTAALWRAYVTFTTVLGVGLKVARALMLGANTVEGLQGTVKGSEKRDVALRVAQEALSFCQDTQGIPMTSKVRDAMQRYNDAYVALQNALAEESETRK